MIYVINILIKIVKMVLKFLKIEEDLNYNIYNIEFQKTKTVFSTTTLKKEEYRITSIEDFVWSII